MIQVNKKCNNQISLKILYFLNKSFVFLNLLFTSARKNLKLFHYEHAHNTIVYECTNYIKDLYSICKQQKFLTSTINNPL